VEVRLVYFDGCPNWQLARTRLRQALDRLGRAPVPISEVQVETADEATAAAFAGSPTIQIDGWDLFPTSTKWAGGLACRLYRTPAGFAGVPRAEDIMSALSERV
jgi:hypothetical protein